ncbi:helix-turn-helix transcriptional regulator [Lentilactobacillus sp. G22-6]|uniref:helix-turn-helix domain-containing protein n=1 Tax=Lentilactobacillus dabitei TaxID=2831523 RepID=UPI001C27A149|nr:helix-turn-helix domain-containing protein [Lentilactobacillus dabitei]MBU9788879.1 helix-turn-helix transcriptional regulator [Lentilactobacillus dabitei]
MDKLLDTFLEKKNLSRYQIAKETGIAPTTLQRSSDKDALAINPRVYAAIAQVLHETPGQVFDAIIGLEEDTDMTTEETKLLLSNTFAKLNANAFISIEDMGDYGSVVTEITLPSEETVRFAVNMLPEKTLTRFDTLTDLGYAMHDFPTDESDVTERGGFESIPAVDREAIAVTKEDSKFLDDLSNRILKIRK